MMSSDTPPIGRDGAGRRHFDPILPPRPADLYARRAARLRALAEGHEAADYLRFAADVVDAQAALLPQAVPATLVDGLIDLVAHAHGGAWLPLLDGLVDRLAAGAPQAVQPHLASLRAMDRASRIAAAIALAEGRFAEVAPAQAPFLWAALSLGATAAAAALPPCGDDDPGPGVSTDCPVCGTAPVASVIFTGERQGQRYLHCACCETRWYVVRATCTNCGGTEHLDYLSFDTAEAAVRAESCGECHGYLKVVSLMRDAAGEAVADDLATLALDAAVAEAGFHRTGFNPFALPA